MTKLNKWLAISLSAAIAVSIIGIVYMANMPKQGDRFTEFYILGSGGKASNYPKEITLGESAEIIVGIINHERNPASYRIALTIDGNLNQEIDIGMLQDGANWEQTVVFTPKKSGKEQKVEFKLYKDASDQPYHDEPLRLFIDVIAK